VGKKAWWPQSVCSLMARERSKSRAIFCGKPITNGIGKPAPGKGIIQVGNEAVVEWLYGEFENQEKRTDKVGGGRSE